MTNCCKIRPTRAPVTCAMLSLAWVLVACTLSATFALIRYKVPATANSRSVRAHSGHTGPTTSDDGGVDLSTLRNVEKDGEWLSKQIKLWLDTEWIIQPIHEKIGRHTCELYVKSRLAQMQDLTDVLMEIGTGLEKISFCDPTGDAYVNAWEVANKASDLLMLRLDRELCNCMGDMSIFNNSDSKTSNDIQISSKRLSEVSSSLSLVFDRYKWMGSFLDGDHDDTAVMAVLALVLGFREDSMKAGNIVYERDVGAYGWQQICESDGIPNLLDTENEKIAERLAADIPEDSEITDVAIEPIVGVEMYRQLTDPTISSAEEKRRVLLAKWLYVHNFVTGDAFPVTETFTPVHLMEEDDV